jgi:hypothetical protein
MADWDIFFQGDSISPPYSFAVPSRAPSVAPSASPLSTQILTTTEQLEEPNNIIVIPNTDKKVKKKKAIEKPDNIKGAIPTEKLKYYQYLTFTAPRLYSKDIYNKENDLVAAIREAFGKDNKENLSNKSDVKSGGFEDAAVIQKLQNDLFNEQEWAAKNIRDQAEADTDYITRAPERLARAKNIFRTKVLKKAPYVPELREPTILPSRAPLRYYTTEQLDAYENAINGVEQELDKADFAIGLAERENNTEMYDYEKKLIDFSRNIRDDIVKIQNTKKYLKKNGEKVPPELAQELKNKKATFTNVQKKLKETDKRNKAMRGAPRDRLQAQGKNVRRGRPPGSKNKSKDERQIRGVMNDMVSSVIEESRKTTRAAKAKAATEKMQQKRLTRITALARGM